MPIHLPPISRRSFLRRTILTTAALAVAPAGFAADKKTDDDFWALFSDPHIAADRALLHNNVNMSEHFEAVIREVAELPALPAGIFVNGDCAFNSGEKNDYAAVARLLKPLRQAPIHLTLGNHDNRDHFLRAFKAETPAKQTVTDKVTSLVSAPKVNWFVLDSLDKTLSTPGVLGKPQLEWLAKSLDANPDKPALVMVHHNPGMTVNVPGLTDTAALLEVIRPRKQVKAYFFGHTHFWSVTQDDSGIHFINLPPTSYVFKEGKPSGWVRATVSDAGMKLQLRCQDTTHKQHGEIHDLKWRA